MKRRGFVVGLGLAAAGVLVSPLLAAPPKEATVTLEITGMT